MPELVQFQYRKKMKEEHRLGDVSTNSGGLPHLLNRAIHPNWFFMSKDFSAGEEHRKSEDGQSLSYLRSSTMSHDVALSRGIFNMSVALVLGSYSSFEYLRRQTFNGWVLDKAPWTFRKWLGRHPQPIKTLCLVPSKHR